MRSVCISFNQKKPISKVTASNLKEFSIITESFVVMIKISVAQ